MRDTYLIIGAAVAAIVAPALILEEPLALTTGLGAVAALALLLGLPKNRVGAFGLSAAITLTVAVPASEFSGTFRQGLSALAIMIMLVSYLRSDVRRPLGKTIWLLPAWLLILALGGISTDAAVKWAIYAGITLVAVLLATRASPRPVLRWVVVLALVQAGVAALQVLGGLTLPWEQVTAISGNEILGAPWTRGPGTMGHPLPMAFLLVAACAILLRDRDWLPVVGRMAAYAVLAGGVVLAGSRSGALILAFLLIFASARRLDFPTWFFGSIAVAVSLLLVVASGFLESQTFEKIMASGSVYHRQGALESFGRLFTEQGAKEVFLGGGYTGVPAAFELGLLQGDGFKTVDNQFITLMVTSGLLGLAIMTWFLLSAFQRSHENVQWVLFGSVGMFMIFDVLLWTSSTVVLMTAVGFALSSQRTHTKDSQQGRPESKVGSPIEH